MMDCAPSLQSMLHNKAIFVNSTTPTVICIVLNKQHWSHKCGCQYIQYNSAPYTHHKLRRLSVLATQHTHFCLILCLILRATTEQTAAQCVPYTTRARHYNVVGGLSKCHSFFQ